MNEKGRFEVIGQQIASVSDSVSSENGQIAGGECLSQSRRAIDGNFERWF
jgi:hypothetical protein